MADKSVLLYKLSTIINSVNSSASYNFSGMHNLIKAADNFQASPFEEIDEQLFMEFMNKVPVWEYYGISREVYLSCSDSDKRDKINKYYSDMKSRSSGGKHFFIFFLWIFERMQPKLVGILESRGSLASKILEAVEWVSERCFYCHNCRECYIRSALQEEVNRKA